MLGSRQSRPAPSPRLPARVIASAREASFLVVSVRVVLVPLLLALPVAAARAERIPFEAFTTVARGYLVSQE